MYEYDLLLSKYLQIDQSHAAIFLKAGRDLPKEQRPKESVIVDCMNTTWTKEMVTDEVVGNIATRWRQFGCLRQLYLDDLVSKEFQDFRAQFASKLSAEARGAIVEPGVVKSDQSQQSHTFGHDFKARFHRSLCLHSIAIASRNIAQVAVVDGCRPSHPKHLKDLSDQTTSEIQDMWTKERIVIGGETRLLGLDIKLDCLEVFDFLYLFLLRKVLPRDRLEDWTREDLGDWPYYEGHDDDDIDTWYSFINHCRWVLQPQDLVDLIKHRAWAADSHYPEDKSEYMRVRSLFDMGADNDSDWYSRFERYNLTHSLLSNDARPVYKVSEDRCWWDRARVNAGSPFQSGFLAKFMVERSRYVDSGGEELRLNGRHCAMSEANSLDHNPTSGTSIS